MATDEYAYIYIYTYIHLDVALNSRYHLYCVPGSSKIVPIQYKSGCPAHNKFPTSGPLSTVHCVQQIPRMPRAETSSYQRKDKLSELAYVILSTISTFIFISLYSCIYIYIYIYVSIYLYAYIYISIYL